jgi:hypothetical protein
MAAEGPSTQPDAVALASALSYAARGWSVVPVHGIAHGRCTCGRADCPAPGKHPHVRWEAAMHERASKEQIRDWWRRWPDANVAIVTGCVSGLVVLDIDPRSGGDGALAALEAHQGPVPRTVEARSGGGGRHLWFAAPGELSSIVLAPGVELKAERSTVIAPPSLHVSGARYAWLPGRGPDEVCLAPLPGWLGALAGGDATAQAPNSRGDSPVRTTQEQEEFAAAWARAGVVVRRGDHSYLCPFHDDTHPSLHVDAEGCRWYCFGCRKGGGIGSLRRLLGEPARPVERARRRGRAGTAEPITLVGDREVHVVGESLHQDELLVLAGGHRPFGGVDLEAVARLELDDSDPVETLVVRVLIDDACVGHLELEDARAYARLVERVRAACGSATCAARLRGGWDRGGDDVGMFGVVLLLPAPDPDEW